MTTKINTGGTREFVYPKEYEYSRLTPEEIKELHRLQDKAKKQYEIEAQIEAERVRKWKRRWKIYKFMDGIRPYIIGAIIILSLVVISGYDWWPNIWQFITRGF